MRVACCALPVQFAKALAQFVDDQHLCNLKVWTSLLKSTIQTAADFDAHKEHWKALNEIDAVRPVLCVVLYLFNV